MRTELPSGTVTFLFTDVEGSTRLLHELGADAYAEALAEHRRVIREACAAEGGVEVDTQGDAFFFAFPTAPGALAAAEAMTEGLAIGPIQVRIGLHTGTPLLAEEGYVGADVHRAARIAAVGHGGQVILSRSTAELVEGSLIDLGEHRLKDISEAVPIFQLGDGSFPPLKTISNTNLPRPASSFVGRARETEEVVSLLREGRRLVTLSGPGGSGKTRLAIEAAAELVPEFKAGVFWVGLATVRDPALVTETISQTLGAANGLSEHIAEREMLLLLDNLEQVIDAATDVSELLTACPNLALLVTSRELLRVRGEVEYAVPPLADREAVELFCERSRLTSDDTIAELCERLDNLPLAVELAAARTNALSPGQILDRLSQRLDLLKGGRDAEARQQTLRATIEWSYELLSPEEQRLFARLSVFAGCTVEAAEEVAGADLDSLQSLVDQSLAALHGGALLDARDDSRVRGRASTRVGRRGSAAEASRRVPRDLAATLGLTLEGVEAGATQRYDVAIAEHDNARGAIDWALEADPVLALRLATALENFWISHSPFEASRMFEELVARADDMPDDLEALTTRCRGDFAIFTDDRRRGLQLYEESLEQYRRLGDEHGQAILEHRLGHNLILFGEVERGRALEESSLARSRAHGFRINEAMCRASVGELEYEEGNVERGLALIADSLELAREVGYQFMQANLLNALAGYTFEQGRTDEAERYARSALAVARDMGDRRHAVQALALLAALAAGRGEPERAGRLWGALETVEQAGALGQRPRLVPGPRIVSGSRLSSSPRRGRTSKAAEGLAAASRSTRP